MRTIIAASLLTAMLFATDASAVAPDADTGSLVEQWDAGTRNANLALNIGLRFARADELGPATLWLERAHHLAPRDRAIEDAVGAVRSEIRRRRAESSTEDTFTDGEPAALSWWRTFGTFPAAVYAWALLICVWIGFGALLVRRRAAPGTARDALLAVAATALVIGATAAVWWSGSVTTAERLRPVVVVDAAARGREAPDQLSPATHHPDLFSGAVGLIRDERDQWALLELVDGHRLWVESSSVAPIVD
jgi:hypothetical protein